jgi:ATP-dependent protease ClpP protease subunit
MKSSESGEMMSSSTASVTEKTLSTAYKFYLSGPIGNPSQYTQWFETIRSAGETDVVLLYINSQGGDLFTAIQFMRVMAETKATVVASVEGLCMSAATLIFLSAKHWEISKHSMFMFHNYSGVVLGKGGEMYDQVIHSKSWSERLWRDTYNDFLTDAELNTMLENKDIWLTGEEVEHRLKKKIGMVKTPKKTAVRGKKTAKTAKKVAKKARRKS